MSSTAPSFVVQDQSDVLAFLERRLAPARRIDTHGAVVFLTGEHAYKLKRAVRFPYMDFSTRERRAAMCAAEIAVNRRLAPNVYLGVAAIRRDAKGALTLGEVGEEADDAVDWLVVMRRFDEDGLLDRMAARDALTPELMAALGARIAAFHDSIAPVSGFSGPEDYRSSVAADIEQMRKAGDRLDPATSEALAVAMPAALEPHLASSRAGWRRARCGAATAICICAISCCSTVRPCRSTPSNSPTASPISTYSTTRLHLMDLLRRGLGLSPTVCSTNGSGARRDTGKRPPTRRWPLLPLFLARRASIRAYVDQAAAAVRGEVDETARAYQHAALEFLEPAPPRLVAIGGLSGSGKTTLALNLAPDTGRAPGAVGGAQRRGAQAAGGRRAGARMPAGSYRSEIVGRRLRGLPCGAERALRAGQSVILDAVFAREDERHAAEALAREVGVPFEGIWLDVPKNVAQARVAARRGDASDATPAVVERQYGYDLGRMTWQRR